ncbi:MAG TPA: cytochrome c [Candidatus Baltobacteraceae bacterium]|jgi:mono/diheme cytochrome c family protein|nr:cytochrome c [Candidatus Baltobacteraceae bacterium]
MSTAKVTIATLAVCLGLLGLGGYLTIISGQIPANADASPSAFERWAARTSLNATVAHEAPKGDAPIRTDAANLESGLHLYANNCAVCHGVADAKPSTIAQGLYQRPPQLAKHGVEDDPVGYTFWKVKHGIRLTGMPAFTKTLNDTQIWQISVFLSRMNHLPTDVDAHWRKLRAYPNSPVAS